ncbi:MAG: nuclear transport factor 2 family protein [Boseongicola sp.]|nr:nuclear transport factor 2 family protein [Boseongicola sp.]
MTTEEIAKRLCEHCRNHTEAEGLKELYAENAESVEAMEVHSFDLEGPFVHDNQFTVVFDVDVTDKASGQRWHSKEVGLYEVYEGKIVKESFFMAPMS